MGKSGAGGDVLLETGREGGMEEKWDEELWEGTVKNLAISTVWMPDKEGLQERGTVKETGDLAVVRKHIWTGWDSRPC